MVYTGIVLGTEFQGIPLNETEIKEIFFHVKVPFVITDRNKTYVNCRFRWLVVHFGVSGTPLKRGLDTAE